MTDKGSENHDALVSLLWELKAAWQARTGKDVLLTDLLLERRELDRFLAEAATVDDERIRTITTRILSLRASLGPEAARSAPGAASASRAGSPPPPPAAKRTSPPAATGFERLRGGAGLVASVLLSVAALRYLFSGETPPPTPVVAAVAASPVAAGSLPVPKVDPRASTPASTVAPPGSASGDTAGKASTPAASTAPAVPAPPTLADSDVVLRIHGSNTIGEKLCPALVDAFLRTKGAKEIVPVPGATSEERSLVARIPGRARPLAIEIHAHGSATAFTDLAAGRTDLGQASRRIKPEEIAALAASHGDLSKPGSEHVLALDGVAIIVHPQNPVGTLSIDQIAKIFAGKVKDWSELGGDAGPIALYARDDASGTWDTFKNLVLAPGGLSLDASAHRIESSSDLSDAVAADVHAIGFIGLPYVRRSKLLAVSAQQGGLALVPTPFTVGTEDYPLSRRLYFYAPPDSANTTMREFVDFALSDAGQEIVTREGFVSQNVSPETPSLDANAPAEYREAARGGQRLSLDFRFQPGSEDLDGKALRDLDRIVAFLARNRGREILLLGFTDDRGNARTNLALSKKRADVVAKALETRGVFSRDVHGFGAELPVASNTTDEGRNRNRRVEVWIR